MWRTEGEVDSIEIRSPQRMIGMDERVVRKQSLERTNVLRIRQSLMPAKSNQKNTTPHRHAISRFRDVCMNADAPLDLPFKEDIGESVVACHHRGWHCHFFHFLFFLAGDAMIVGWTDMYIKARYQSGIAGG